MPEMASMWSSPRLFVPTTARRSRFDGAAAPGAARSHDGMAAATPRPRPAAALFLRNSRRLVRLLIRSGCCRGRRGQHAAHVAERLGHAGDRVGRVALVLEPGLAGESNLHEGGNDAPDVQAA